MCVEFSEEEIGESILRAQMDGADVPNDDAALLELVDQLLSRDVAMWVFVYTVTDIYGPGEITESVRSVVTSHLAEPVLSREQRRNLHQLCNSLVGLDVPRLFALSVDRVGYPLRSDPANLCAVLNELEEFPARARDGLHPIAVFVDYLASDQPPESADRLRAWVNDFVGSRTPHVTALRKIRDSQRVPRDPEPWYCTICLDPDGVDASLFYLSVYFQEGEHPLEPLLPPDDAAYTEEQTRTRIGEVLNSRHLAGIHPADLRIEFYLPVVLINLPVDRWRVGVAGITLGVQYQVVIRSLNRLRELGSAQAYWREKSSRLRTTEFRGVPGTEWLREEAADHHGDQTFVRLIRASGPVCLLLAETPAPDRCRALLLAFTAGIPVLMWSRRPAVALSSCLSDLLADGDAPLRLSDLPRRVLKFRRDAADQRVGEDHIANHLTLLYDDGGRISDAGSLLQTLA